MEAAHLLVIDDIGAEHGLTGGRVCQLAGGECRRLAALALEQGVA